MLADVADYEDIVESGIKECCSKLVYRNYVHQFRHMTLVAQKIVAKAAYELLTCEYAKNSSERLKLSQCFQRLFVYVSLASFTSRPEHPNDYVVELTSNNLATIPIFDSKLDWLHGIDYQPRDDFDHEDDFVLSLIIQRQPDIDYNAFDLDEIIPDLTILDNPTWAPGRQGTISHRHLKVLTIGDPNVKIGYMPSLLVLNIFYADSYWPNIRKNMVADSLQVLSFANTNADRLVISDMPKLKEIKISECYATLDIRTESLPCLESVYMFGHRNVCEPVEQRLLGEGFRRAIRHNMRPVGHTDRTGIYVDRNPIAPYIDTGEFSVSRNIKPWPLLG